MFWRLLPAVLAFMLLAISGRGQTYLQESFDDATFPPTGWTQAQLNLTGLWARATSGTSPTCGNHSGAGMLKYNCYSYSNGTAAAIISPSIDLSAASNVSVEFWMYRDAGFATNVDNVEVLINTTANVTGATSLGVINRPKTSSPAETGADGWYKYSFTIPASFNTATNYLLFKATAKYGNNIFVDDIKVFTPTIPNGSPTTFSTTAVSKTGMTINWVDNSTDETGFSVYMSSDNIAFSKYGTDIVSTSSGTTGNAYSTNITGLTYGHTYYFKIVAYSGGETAPLTGNQATLPGDAGDAAPTSLTFTSVGLSAMTLNWVDNSTNETAFRVYRATDIAGPYTQVGTDIPSTTSAGIGTGYNAVSTGLTQSTTYFYKVVAVCDLESPALTGSQATTAPVPMSGTYTVGHTAANYQSLTAAFTDITGNGLSGPINLVLQADYDAYDEPAFPIVPSKIATAANTITIYPATSGVIIDPGGQPSGLFNFDGVNYVTFDGRVGATGNTKDLVIKNGSFANYVFQFVNDASNNTIKYCIVKGGTNSGTIGLINFAGTTGSTGNDNNLIDNCDLLRAVVNNTIGIYSSGSTTAGKENSGNIISNCNIYDFFNAAASSYGIYIAAGNTDWTINKNNFYQTGSRTYTTASIHYGINIAASSGNNFTVTDNNIGGSAANTAGSPWTLTYSTALANRFVGIKMSVGSTTASNVQGNTIANMALNSSSGATTSGGVWCGIYVAGGKVNVGDVKGNNIGNTTSNGSITSTITTNGGLSTGIYVDGTTTSTVANNIVGSINVAGSSTSIGHSFGGIVTAGGNVTINNNTIGSLTTSNSINATTGATGTTAQVVTGINNSSSGTITISNNSIANLNNAYAPSSASSKNIVSGILSSNGATTISGNTIKNLSTAANATGTSGFASVIGIALTSSVAPALISQNSVYNLTNNYSGISAVLVTGIFYNGPTSGTNVVERNQIYGLATTSTSESATITGIQINGGSTTYQNNMVSLGQGLATGYAINGIYEFMGTNNLYFNSIYIGGTATTSNQKTYALFGNQTLNPRIFKNNILVNARSTSAGSGKNYAVKVGGSGINPTGLTCDYNIYQVSGSAGIFGFFNNADVADLTAWQTAVGQDAHSLNVDPKFVNPTAATPDLHLQGGSPADMAGIDIPTITNDFFGDIRASLTPVDMGADAGNFDNVAPTVTVTPLDGTTGINVGDNIVFSFSEKVRKTDNSAIDASVISFVNITDGNSAVPFAVVYDDVAKTLTVKLSPDGTAMLGFKNYKVTITGVEDYNDNALAATSTSFTTGTADAIAPTFVSAVVENAAPQNVVVTFSENVKMDNANGFAVKVGGNPATISGNSLSNNQLTLTLAETVTTHQVVTVEYAGGNVKDISDNVLADFAAQSVTNNTKSSAKDFLTFNLLKADNPALTEDMIGAVSPNLVGFYISSAITRTGLKASFTTSQYVQSVEVASVTQTSGVTANDFTTDVTYKITAEDNSVNNIVVKFHNLHAIPYAQNFDATTFPPADWSILNAGTGNSWNRSGTAQAGAGSMYYYPNPTNAANAWAFSPGISLEANKKYVIEFWEKVASLNSHEKLKVTVGNLPTVSGQTTELWKDENLTNSSWAKVKAVYTPTVSGNFHFGFNCYSDANQYNLFVDEVNVREVNHNASLSGIKVDGTALAGFAAATYTYTKVLPFGTTTIPAITATAADANASMVITQVSNIAGNEAERTATVAVTAEDGTTTITYTIVFSVAKNPDANLTDLKVDGKTITGFSSSVYEYSITLPYGTIAIPQITAVTLSNTNASNVIKQATSLAGSTVERTASVVVTAEDGITTATYSVVFSVGEPNKFAVSYSVVGTNGTLTAVVDGSYITNGELVIEGKSVEFGASPAAGYRVKEWKNNGSIVANNTSNTLVIPSLTATATVTVEFEQIPATTYAVNFSVIGTNGTIAATADGNAIATGDLVVEGKKVEFNAQPATGYRVKEWNNNGSVVANNTSNTLVIANLTATATVTVEFEQIPVTTYAVNFSVVGTNGTITATVDGNAITTGALVAAGKSVIFTATPAANYKVKEWKNGTVVEGNTTNSYTISGLASEVNVTVEFMSTTGIEEAEEANVQAYPNPFQSSIFIKNATEITRVEILGLGGQTLKSLVFEQCSELTINTDDLMGGVYFIRLVDTMGKVTTKKMIKE